MFKERLLLPFVAVAGALLVAGCGGSSGGGGDDTAEVETPVVELNTTGYQAFLNLSAGLLDTAAEVDATSGLDMLRSNRYHDVPDVAANANADPAVEAEDNGGGVTSSLTTHEEPADGGAGTGPGVSDIFVTVMAESMAASADDATAEIDTLDTNGMVVETEIPNPVTDTNGRSASFDAAADWDSNPAAEWATTDPLEGGDPADAFWTYSFNSADEGQKLSGGRKLHLDLRTDFDPNFAELLVTDPVGGYTIARGPGSNEPIRADWDDVTGLDVDDQGEIDFAETAATGVVGTYQGIKGRFHCEPGGADDNICRINRHTVGELGVSQNDTLVFTPYEYKADTDWLAAGVWLTVPDDEDGDYAIGAFVYGNMPYKPTSVANADGLDGTATYAGQAFGRFAEDDAGRKEVGRFTADAELTAVFNGDTGDDAAGIGSIYGDLTGFMANGESKADWDVNFEKAMIMLGMMGDPAERAPNTAMRFNAGASGHATGGHAMTGYWNGQFYGPAAETDPELPGSAAGTFGLTTERDPHDEYSLVIGGAFAAHAEED